MRANPYTKFVIALVLSTLLVGCGYRFVRYRAAGGDAPRISVTTLQNDSEEAGIELLATEALRHEILTRGGLELVSGRETPQFVLQGRVLPLLTRSQTFTGSVLAREYGVTLRLELWVDSAAAGTGSPGHAGMAREEFGASEIYLASADVAVLRKNRTEALRYLSGLLASRAHDAIDRMLLGVLR